MHTDSILRFVFGPAALPLGIVSILYLSSVLRNGYFTSKGGEKIYRDKQPGNFWTGVTIGMLVSAALIVSAVSYFVGDKTILEYSDTRQQQQASPDAVTGKGHGLAPYTP